MMRIFIVDDQSIERFHMRVLFKHCPDVCVIGESGDVEDAAEQINALQPDAIFLDVDLGKKKTGFDLLPLIETAAKIVFVTLYNDFAVRAFRVNALDYLMKPVTLERLSETLIRLNQQVENPVVLTEQAAIDKQDCIHLKEGGRQTLVPVSQVCAVEASGDYTHVYTCKNGAFYIRRSMKEWQAILPSEWFVVLDRKLIVGIQHMSEVYADDFRRGVLTVRGVGHDFILGKTALKEARRVMKRFGV